MKKFLFILVGVLCILCTSCGDEPNEILKDEHSCPMHFVENFIVNNNLQPSSLYEFSGEYVCLTSHFKNNAIRDYVRSNTNTKTEPYYGNNDLILTHHFIDSPQQLGNVIGNSLGLSILYKKTHPVVLDDEWWDIYEFEGVNTNYKLFCYSVAYTEPDIEIEAECYSKYHTQTVKNIEIVF